MSKSLTVRLTDSRSSARSAPIWYTPPVKPPPPSTSAVFEDRRRRCGRPPPPWLGRSFAPASRLTTLPMQRPSLMAPRRQAVRLACALCVVLGLAAPASALSPPSAARELARALRPAGGASGALVVDLTTRATIYRAKATVRRMPASVEKLYTTSTALLRLGRGFTL